VEFGRHVAHALPAMNAGCESGVWPAVQAFIAFFATNILAHAASIRVPAGRSTSLDAGVDAYWHASRGRDLPRQSCSQQLNRPREAIPWSVLL